VKAIARATRVCRWALGWGRGVWVVLLTLSGCGRPAAPVRGLSRFESNAGHYTVALASSPDPIPLGRPFDITVTVTPHRPSPPELEVVIDARMPEHFHGMNRVARMVRLDPTTWRGEGLLFHMPGHWELYVDITRDGMTERAQMDVYFK